MNCKKCRIYFEIAEEDKILYDKLGVIEPTFCPSCRHQRRLAWRNDRTFYKRKCDKTGKEFISIYSPESPYNIYHPDEWYSDNWDPMNYARPFDFSRPFFEQFKELQRAVPRLGIDIVNCQNSYFCNYCGDDKDCYLDIAGEANEDCYFNLFTKYSKEDFLKRLKELNLGSYEKREECIKKWNKFRIASAIYKDAYLFNCENCTGDNLKNCKNTHWSFNATNCEDCKYLYDVLDAKDCQDLNYSLYKPEVGYELISTLNMTYSAFNMASHYCNNTFYSEMCNHSGNLFGCIGLKHKDYCILNKQYTREAFLKLRLTIIEHMKCTGEWGEFFPASISPWGYNETVANEYFPLGADEAKKQGFIWYENPNEPKVRSQNYEIPDNIADAPDTIINETLACADCRKNYKIIQQELKYYKQKNIPIPRKCPSCRHQDRIKLRLPRRLFNNKCSNCKKEILTPFSSSRPEKIYCEKCYLNAVY